MHLQMILKEIEIPKSVCLLAGMDFDILENNHLVYTVNVKTRYGQISFKKSFSFTLILSGFDAHFW